MLVRSARISGSYRSFHAIVLDRLGARRGVVPNVVEGLVVRIDLYRRGSAAVPVSVVLDLEPCREEDSVHGFGTKYSARDREHEFPECHAHSVRLQRNARAGVGAN